MSKGLIFSCFALLFCSGIINAQTSYLLIARNTGEKILASGDTIRVFGFATSLGAQPSIPGPTIYANEGDSVLIDLFNVSQGAPHTIHLHGLDVNQQNDGVGHLSFEVDHMDHGYYRFKAPHPGTYLYHCHVTSPVHVQAGMYGLVIIRPASGSDSTWSGGYSYDRDFPLVTSEIDTVWHQDTLLDHAHDTSSMLNYVELPFYDPQFFLVNGLSDQQLSGVVEINASVGEKNYLRLANLGFYANRFILPSGLNAEMVDSDGRPLPISEQNDTIVVFPGERFGVLTEATVEFTDSILIEYLDLNTWNIKGEQSVLVNIDGFFNVDEVIPQEGILAVFPNPGNEIFQLHFYHPEANSAQIEIYDESGKNIFSETVFFSDGELSHPILLDGLAEGLFFLKLTDNRGGVRVSKFMHLR